MKYLMRKILSAIAMIGIGGVVVHATMTQFTNEHLYAIVACVAVLLFIAIGKFIRKIIFFPFNLLRKVLFRF